MADSEYPIGESIDIGRWSKDGLFWLIEHGQRMIEPVEDFTQWLIRKLIGFEDATGFLTELPWYAWPLAFFAVGVVSMRPTRGLRAAIALTAVNALDPDIWLDATRTASLVMLGVAMGTVLAFPVGLVGHFSTGLRRAIRRISDVLVLVALSSVLIPLVFVFGLGAVPAVWAMTLITFTQMTRAFVSAFGVARTDRSSALSELAGALNTGLLIATVLQSSFALVGSGGLGRLQFRATNNLNLTLHFTISIAIIGIALAFDQVTRPAGRNGAFLDRTHEAWRLPVSSQTRSPIPQTFLRTAPPTIVGAAIVLFSLVLPWSKNRGTISSHLRDSDLSLPGESFNGIDELGGSSFGLVIGALAAGALVGVVIRAVRRSGPPADFTTVIGAAITIVSIAYLTTAAAPLAASSGISIGAGVALVGGLIMLFGTALQRGGGAWIDVDPSARLGYLATGLALGTACLLVVLGSSIGWIVDLEPPGFDSALPANLAGEITRLREEAGDDINKQIANAQTIQNLINQAEQPVEPSHIGGLHVDGPHTAFTVLIASGLSALAILATMITRIDRLRWIAFGLGLGGALAAAAWIASTAIEHDVALQTDGGPFIAMLGAGALAAIARRSPARARQVPAEIEEPDVVESEEPAAAVVEPPVVDPEPATEIPPTIVEIPDVPAPVAIEI